MKRKSIVSLTVVIAVILLIGLFVVPMALAGIGGTDRPFKATLVGTARAGVSWRIAVQLHGPHNTDRSDGRGNPYGSDRGVLVPLPG